jgi:hypothetical protein
MPKKRSPGRPKLPPGQELDDVFRLRLRSAEKAELEAAAERVDEKASAWARKILLNAARSVAQ